MKLLLIICFFINLFNEITPWRIFHRGRSVGGNLGLPRKVELTLGDNVIETWFNQTLDHFNPTDTRRWQQRYFVNSEYAVENGPVFLMIGGEGEASEKWMTQGTWIDYAKKFGALCFQLEHRFYGKSHPTKDLSVKNLQYLSSQQALADLAMFIVAMNEKHQLPVDVKWIAFGGSYPGSLAAWLRAKYPHLVQGAMSASGPLLAELDFKTYFKVVDEALSTYSDDCVSAVKEGTDEINTLSRHMIGQKNIDTLFNLCDPVESSMSNKYDIANLFETLAGNFAGIVQYNKDNRIGKDVKGANITIDTLCDIMTNQTLGTPVERLASVNDLLLSTYNQSCLDYKYDKMINELRNTSWLSETSEGGRQWTYQTCTEFGFFQTSSFHPQVFSDYFPANFFVQQCVDIFGTKFNKSLLESGIDRTNALYGGYNLKVSNVVFVHGSIDPWHELGITKTLNPESPAIFIEGTAHCANMYPKSENDLPELTEARKDIARLIAKWLYF